MCRGEMRCALTGLQWTELRLRGNAFGRLTSWANLAYWCWMLTTRPPRESGVEKTYVPTAFTWRLGVWEGLVNGFHTASAPLLICSPVTILRKQYKKQTWSFTNSELQARSEVGASLIRRINTTRLKTTHGLTQTPKSTQHRGITSEDGGRNRVAL